jgi:hypothetical protein
METFLPIISKGCSESEFITTVTIVAALERDTKLWLADASLFAIKRWGRDRGLQLLHEATGFKKASLNSASYTAAAFPPEKRYDYGFNHLRFMKPYAHADASWTDAFLARHQDDKVSSRDLRSLAQREYAGKDGESKKKPVVCRSPKKCSVTIRADIFARLRLHNADGKISVMIDRILEEWLSKQPNAPAVTVKPETVKPETKKVKKALAVRERAAARKKVREEKEAATAAKQKVREEKAAAEQKLREEKAAALAARPTYEQRRLEAIAAGAARFAVKPRKSTPLRRQWTTCAPLAMVDGEFGPSVLQHDYSKFPTRFWSAAAAQLAADAFEASKGFRETVIRCETCSKAASNGGRLKREVFHVKHVFSASDGPDYQPIVSDAAGIV